MQKIPVNPVMLIAQVQQLEYQLQALKQEFDIRFDALEDTLESAAPELYEQFSKNICRHMAYDLAIALHYAREQNNLEGGAMIQKEFDKHEAEAIKNGHFDDYEKGISDARAYIAEQVEKEEKPLTRAQRRRKDRADSKKEIEV